MQQIMRQRSTAGSVRSLTSNMFRWNDKGELLLGHDLKIEGKVRSAIDFLVVVLYCVCVFVSLYTAWKKERA